MLLQQELSANTVKEENQIVQRLHYFAIKNLIFNIKNELIRRSTICSISKLSPFSLPSLTIGVNPSPTYTRVLYTDPVAGFLSIWIRLMTLAFKDRQLMVNGAFPRLSEDGTLSSTCVCALPVFNIRTINEMIDLRKNLSIYL